MNNELVRLLRKVEHELITTNGLTVTDKEEEADKMNTDCKWRLNNNSLVNEINETLKKIGE